MRTAISDESNQSLKQNKTPIATFMSLQITCFRNGIHEYFFFVITEKYLRILNVPLGFICNNYIRRIYTTNYNDRIKKVVKKLLAKKKLDKSYPCLWSY